MDQDDRLPVGVALLGVVDLGPGAQDSAGKAKLRTGVMHIPPDLAATGCLSYGRDGARLEALGLSGGTTLHDNQDRPEIGAERGLVTARGHEPTVRAFALTSHGRDHQRPSATPPPGVQVMRASGPEDSGARLGRLSHWPLGSCEGLIEVGSQLGHDLLDAADRRLPAAFATGVTLAGFSWGRGPDDDLVPGDLLVDEDGHGHLQSVGDGRTYPLGKPVTKFPGRGSYVVRRDQLASPGPDVRDGRNTLVCSAVLVGEVLP
jgi:hypothetical protein